MVGSSAVLSSQQPQNLPGVSQVLVAVRPSDGSLVDVSSLQPQIFPGVSQVLVDVDVPSDVVVVSSLQPQIFPGVSQEVVDDVEVVVVVVVVVGSLQPQNFPGVSQVVVDVGTDSVGEVTGGLVVVVVVVWLVVVVDTVVVVLSLQPNQPGVLQVEVEEELLVVVVVTSPVVVVVSSRQPHQPGVLHVSVRVRVVVVLDGFEVVVDSVPLLSYIFQFAQSLHSGVNLHSGTVSYFNRTSLMTDKILCVPTPTRQPLSATTS